MNDDFENLLLRLENIAQTNDDEFGYTIDVIPRQNKLRYSFNCYEKADGHTFVSSCGYALADVLKDAENEIPQALADWGYDEGGITV